MNLKKKCAFEIKRVGIVVSQHKHECLQETYHNAGAYSDTSAAICVWHNVTKTDGEKCYRNKPHRIE